MERPQALVVDKDPAIRALIRDLFEEQEVGVLGADSEANASDVLKDRAVDFLIVGLSTPGVDASALLRLSMEREHVPIVLALADAASDGRAQELIRAGAFDVLASPPVESELQSAVLRILRQRDVLEDLRRLREELQSREGYNGLVGRTAPMERVREQLDRLSGGSCAVCFTGESGSGKEWAARTLHDLSRDGDAPFVVVDCAPLSGTAWEACWTGASGGESLRHEAGGGSVYFEGLAALSADHQVALAREMSAGSPGFRVFGSFKRHPSVEADEGRLVPELFSQLAAEVVTLPPLREREGDIAILARHFISAIREINNLPPIRLAPESLALLERYRWPENVRELRTAMEQAVILTPDGLIRPRDLPDRIREYQPDVTSPERAPSSRSKFRAAKREIVEAFERSYLTDLMERHGGNVTAASQQAGMLRSALQRLLRKYDLKSAIFRIRQQRAAASQDAPRSKTD